MDEMRERILAAAKRNRNKCSDFLRELIAIPSPSRGDDGVALRVRKEMLKLGFPVAEVDVFHAFVVFLQEGKAIAICRSVVTGVKRRHDVGRVRKCFDEAFLRV